MKASSPHDSTPSRRKRSKKQRSFANRIIQRSTVRAALGKISRSVTKDANRYDDLLQDALIYVWKRLQRLPRHRWKWYLRRCRFRLLDQLRRGRSLDAFKRRKLAITLTIADDDETHPAPPALVSRENVLSAIIYRDIIDQLGPRLKPTTRDVLSALAEGSGVQETARKLRISHPAVIKQRRKIAA